MTNQLPNQVLRQAGINLGTCERGGVLDYDRTLDALENHGIDHGRKRRRSRDNPLTQDVVAHRCNQAYKQTMRSRERETFILQLVMGGGKTTQMFPAAAETDEPTSIFVNRGRKEQYKRVEEYSEDNDLVCKVLPSFIEDCPSANGEHGDSLAERIKDWYDRGAKPKDIHERDDVPCGDECPYRKAWHFDPVNFDIITGYYTHANVRHIVDDRTVIFDEFPGEVFESVYNDNLAEAVTHFLQRESEIPYTNFADLIEGRHEQRSFDALVALPNSLYDSSLAFEGGYANAPKLVYTILMAGRSLGRFEPVELLTGGIGLFDKENMEVRILSPPNMPYANNVIGLDGTPTPEMWRLAVGEDFEHRRVLSDEERKEFVADTMDYDFVVTTTSINPYNSSVSPKQAAVLIEGVSEAHSCKPGVITTATGEQRHEKLDWFPSHLIGESQHYGNIKSSNNFRRERVGIVIGSNHFGDRFVKIWGAYAGHEVTSPDRSGGKNRGHDLSYGEFGDKILHHMREHETIQAAMRFGRDEDISPIVFVHTNTLPDWVPVTHLGDAVDTWNESERAVIDVIANLEAASTAEVAEHDGVSIGGKQVGRILDRLERRDVVTYEKSGRTGVWRFMGMNGVSRYGKLDLPENLLSDLITKDTSRL
jgi:hypothetical protein